MNFRLRSTSTIAKFGRGSFGLMLALGGLIPRICDAQQATPVNPSAQAPQNSPAGDDAPVDPSTRIFGIIPNNRTAPEYNSSTPIGVKEKFKLGTQDAFDRGTVVLALLFGAEGQITRSNPSFGNGVVAYGKYFGTSYGDFMIGDYMTEAIYSSLLHQDPRYFRHGPGSGWSGLGYAMGQIFWTHTDARGTQFNYSEVLGNATAVAISTSYYPENRSAGDAVSKLGVQLGVDMAGNILKEFWPEIQRKALHKHPARDGNGGG